MQSTGFVNPKTPPRTRTAVFIIVRMFSSTATFQSMKALTFVSSLLYIPIMKSLALALSSVFVLQSLETGLAFAPKNPRQRTCSQQKLLQAQRGNPEDIFAAVHRKEYEMKQVKAQHTSISDPVRVAMSYGQESVGAMTLAKALRRVYDDEFNPANPNAKEVDPETEQRATKLKDLGMAEMGMRRGSFIVDIKRKSLSRTGEPKFCNFDDAGLVAEAMVRLGADAVFVNVDYAGYGGDFSELKSAIRAVRKVSKTAAVVMKDIVVDEIQLGLAKEAGADGILLIASVLGPALDNFLNLATTIGLETIVECHTYNEVQRALEACAQIILVSNYDRVNNVYHPNQAIQLAGLFPGSGGPIITLACGGIDDTEVMKRHLAVGYDGVIVGKAVMGSPRAPEFIRAVRDRTLLPAEFSQWGLEDVEFDMNGQVMAGTKKGIPSPGDDDVYM